MNDDQKKNDKVNESIIIREIRENELDILLELYKHLHADDIPLPNREHVLDIWDKIIKNEIVHCFVLEFDKKIVSSCILTIIPNLTRGARPYGLIENVVTHIDYQGKGLGQKLLKKVLKFAWNQKCYKVMLFTGSKYEWILNFYEKIGFNRKNKTGFVINAPWNLE